MDNSDLKTLYDSLEDKYRKHAFYHGAGQYGKDLDKTPIFDGIIKCFKKGVAQEPRKKLRANEEVKKSLQTNLLRLGLRPGSRARICDERSELPRAAQISHRAGVQAH